MKPWELSTTANNEDHLLRAWARLKAENFYFAGVGDDDEANPSVGLTTIYHGHMYPDSMPISHLLPKCLLERLPSVFYAREPLLKVYNDLFLAGFIHSDAFQAFALAAQNTHLWADQC